MWYVIFIILFSREKNLEKLEIYSVTDVVLNAMQQMDSVLLIKQGTVCIRC